MLKYTIQLFNWSNDIAKLKKMVNGPNTTKMVRENMRNTIGEFISRVASYNTLKVKI